MLPNSSPIIFSVGALSKSPTAMTASGSGRYKSEYRSAQDLWLELLDVLPGADRVGSASRDLAVRASAHPACAPSARPCRHSSMMTHAPCRSSRVDDDRWATSAENMNAFHHASGCRSARAHVHRLIVRVFALTPGTRRMPIGSMNRIRSCLANRSLPLKATARRSRRGPAGPGPPRPTRCHDQPQFGALVGSGVRPDVIPAGHSAGTDGDARVHRDGWSGRPLRGRDRRPFLRRCDAEGRQCEGQGQSEPGAFPERGHVGLHATSLPGFEGGSRR